jgi:membrane fusion protein, multidrug efflux system
MKLKGRTSIILVVIVILAFLLASPRVRKFLPGMGGEKAASERDTRLPVSALVIRPEVLTNKVLATGTVLANEEVELRSEASGKIEKIFFSEGVRVKRGDLLIKINDSELRAQRMKAESQKQVAQEKERRRKQLYEKQGISPEDYESAVNELNGILAQLKLIDAQIEKTEVRAPFEGVIGLRYVSEGSYVDPTVRIANLQDLQSVKLDFAVPEKYVSAVRKGQSVFFRVSGRSERFAGTILAVEPKIDPVTRNVLLRAISPNKEGRIMPGAFAEVELVLDLVSGAVMIPTQALVPDLQGQKVYVCRGGAAQEVRVAIGLRTENKVQVTSGLVPGDTLLTTGLLQVVGGSPLKLVEVL